MLTGEIRSQIDRIWDAFASGGISNPLEVIEQITYLLFLKRLDDLHTLEEDKAARLKLKKLERRVFPEGKDPKKRPYDDLRWSRFKHFEAKEMYAVVNDHVFPFLRTLGGDDSTYAHHMKDARFTIPTPALLAKVVDMIDQLPMEDRDTKGDLYEYMLGKIATAGRNGQFRTPRHIIQLMVELTAPTAKDVICDPACGTGGFLVAAGEYLRTHHPEILRDTKLNKHFHEGAFHGFDFDNTMLRIGSMNMLLHGVENPDIRYRDSLGQDHAGEEEKYTLVLANPPFAGSLDYENCAKDLQQIVKTKKTELLFLALFLRLLKPGGRAAVIVPDGVLFGSSNAHQTLRKILVEEQKLDAVISLPGGVFKPYAGVLRAHESRVDGGYLFHWVKSPAFVADMVNKATGASYPAISDRIIFDSRIPLPPLAEQRRIAEVLDRSEALRAKRRVALAQLDSLAQSLFLDLFGDPATNPKGWATNALDTICRGITDIDHKMPLAVEAGFPFISAKDLTDDGQISFKNVKRISSEDFRRLSRKSKPEKGDIIYSRIGVNLGKARMVKVDFDFLVSYSCCTIKPNREFVDATYLCCLLDSPSTLKQAHKGIRAIAVPDLGMGEIKGFKIILPPISLQREFARRVTAVEALKTAQRTSLVELNALFATLQHRAFRGEL